MSDPVSAYKPSRRVVLIGSGALALGVGSVLAGCGSSGESSGGSGDRLVATADVPVGGAVVVKDARVVVAQPEEGVFTAVTAVCTHQGCVVAAKGDGVLTCPCHGSVFAMDGAVREGPATKPLAEVPVRVQGADVVRA